MNAFEHLVWALGHSLWQAAAVGVALWLALALVPTNQPRLRYVLALGAMILIVFAVCGTWSWLEQPSPASPTPPTAITITPTITVTNAPPAANGAPPAAALPAVRGAPSHWNWAALAGAFWAAGVAVMLVRLVVAVLRAGRLASVGRAVEIPALQELSARLGLRRVRAIVSELYRVPAVVGAWSPVVLVPAAVLAEMSPEQLRMILAHELAHIRRWDFLINVVQQVIEALLFFNPAVWWISRQVRVEREACCDAVAVQLSGNAEMMARTLAVVAARLVDPQDLPLAALAIHRRNSGSILERIRRLIDPARRGQIEFPVRTLVLGLLTAGVVLTAIGSTAELTVRAAEAILSPAQRVDEMARLQKEMGPRNAINREGETPEAQLAGTVRIADGTPLPRKLYVQAHVDYAGGVAGYSIDIDQDGHFAKQVKGLSANVWVAAPGYAPAFTGTLRAGADRKFPSADLLIQPGFDGRIHVADPGGKPVAKAKLALGYRLTLPGGWTTVDGGTYLTDAEGNAVVPHAIDRPAQLKIEVAGFEYQNTTVQMAAAQAVTVTLHPAKPATGIVLDAATRKPLPGATISLIQRKGYDEQFCYPHERAGMAPPVLAVADDAGRFILDQLRTDCSYVLWVAAPGHGAQMIQGISAGDHNLEWALGPAQVIEVQIKADPGHMPREVQVDNPLRLGDSSFDYGFNIPVQQRDGLGIATFQDAIPGVVRFTANSRTVRVETDKVQGPAILDLRHDVPAPKTREIVLKFDWPKDGAAPRGKVRVDYIKPENPDSYFPDEIEVKDGEAHFTVPVPTKIGYSQGTLVGYWIDDQHEIAVPDAATPLIIPIKADPGGAIHGKILDEHGAPFEDYFYVYLVTAKESPGVTNQRRPSMLQPFNANSRDPKYLISPIPLDGTYRLVACAKARFAVSEPMELNAAHPIHEADLQFADGLTLSGRLLSPKGDPLPGIRVDLHMRRAPSSEYSTQVQTDAAGKFVFEHVDSRAGDYSLTISPGQQTQGDQIKSLSITAQPLEIAVKQGLTAHGVVLDVQTGKPMANRRVSLRPVPEDEKRARYPWTISAVTNPQGEFEARGLEDLSYLVLVENSYAPDAKVVRDASGHPTRIEFPGDPHEEPKLKPGDPPQEIKRLPSPWN